MKYIIYQRTIQELIDDAQNNTSGDEAVYKYRNNTIPVDQLIKQQHMSWVTKHTVSLSAGEARLHTILREMVMQSAIEKPDTTVFYDVMTKIKKQKIIVTAEVTDNDVKLREDFEHGVDTLNFSQDVAAFEREIDQKVCRDNCNDIYRIEEIKVCVPIYRFNTLDRKLEKLTKKAIKERLTYCLKNGMVIVPQEYLAKGERGIKEWQEHKRSHNANNSMEKRMLRKLLRDKKNLVHTMLKQIARLAVEPNGDWTIPGLTVARLYNETCMKKLTSTLLKDKSEQTIIALTHDDIVDMCRDYWKRQLNDVIAKMDNFKGVDM